MKAVRKIKQKPCWHCKEPFTPWVSSTQNTCSPPCAIKKMEYDRDRIAERNRKNEQKAKRKDMRERKEKLKSRSDWEEDAQNNGFNPFIRQRDKGNSCISCGKYESELNIKSPIAMVCGHYLSVGAYPELRYHPFNAHLQCTRCNGGEGKYGMFNSKAKTVTQEYRGNLVNKIGIENVEWLEGHHEIQKRTVDDLKEIKLYYREQKKLLTHPQSR